MLGLSERCEKNQNHINTRILFKNKSNNSGNTIQTIEVVLGKG